MIKRCLPCTGWRVMVILSLILYAEMAWAGVRLTSVFNNTPSRKGLKTGWGYACLIQGLKREILFDTGADGERLLENMQKLHKDPRQVDMVVLSHIHHDHVGGLKAFLAVNPDITVYVPASFPSSIKEMIRIHGARVMAVKGPMQIAPAVFTTGQMGHAVKEQALVVKTGEGLVVITGCAHPGIAHMVRRAKTLYKAPVYGAVGGFHLSGRSDAVIDQIIEEMKALGVKTVAPSHCTGPRARQRFKAAWGNEFLDGGLGAVVEIPRRKHGGSRDGPSKGRR